MTREIKFRAWDATEKRWFVPTDYQKKTGASEFFGCDQEIIRFNRGDIILMQFTGLKDKNGREIYEGDILKDVIAELEWVGAREVRWNGTDCEWQAWRALGFIKLMFFVAEKLEVIGNICENPELLKN